VLHKRLELDGTAEQKIEGVSGAREGTSSEMGCSKIRLLKGWRRRGHEVMATGENHRWEPTSAMVMRNRMILEERLGRLV